jgi:hypothetical protein
MPRVARAAIATVPVLLAASCTLVAPLDGLTGAAGGDAATVDGGGTGDATLEGGDDAPAEARGDGAIDGPGGGPGDAAGEHAPGGDAEAGQSAYATAVLADAPLAYWRLDETSGVVCHDATGHGNNATYLGNVSLGVTGALASDPDTAAQFDGTSAQIDVGDKFDFAGSVPMSVELWARPDVIDGTYRHLETKMLYTDAGQPDDGMYFYVHNGPSTLAFERWANNYTDNGFGTTIVTTGAWWHVVGTFDGSTMTLYVNGAKVGSAPTAIVVVANGVHLLWAQAFQGALDELAIYDHALSAARVQAHYQAAK